MLEYGTARRASIGREGDVNGCLMMKWEEMTTVEPVNYKAIRGHFARDHGNMMLIE